MTNTAHNGGPAFASDPAKLMYDENDILKPLGFQGMSMRDYFAGQALSGIAATDGCLTYAKDAEMAYRYADAMLKAREET